MKTKRLANKIVIAVAALLALGGTVISVLQLIESVKYTFDYYSFIPAVLYILCFVDLVIYASTGVLKSPIAFRAVLVAYGLVIITTGLVWPPVFPNGTKVIFMALSAFVLLGILGFNKFGLDVKKAKIFLALAFVAECAYTYGALTGDPMNMEDNTIAQLATFIRPIILSCLAVCYLARMNEKAHSAAEGR